MRELSAGEGRRLRLRAQGLEPSTGLGPVDVVRRAVALQGQDVGAVLRAIAVRSAPGTTLNDVRAAFDAGELVRGWTQRGTLFATTPADLAALLSLTAERVERSLTRRRLELGLESDVLDTAEAVVRAALGAGGALRRADLMRLWQDAGVRTDEQRGYHLILFLSTRGLMHWGPFAGAEQLLVASPPPAAVRVAESGEDALARIATAYLSSRGPATIDDVAWWLGLPKTPLRATCRELLEGGRIEEVSVDGRPHLMPSGAAAANRDGRTVVLAPAFDEWVLGYQDRSLVASPEMLAALTPGGNGVFRPTVLIDGRIVATWRLAPRTREPIIDVVEPIDDSDRRAIDAAIAAWPHD